jgi:hypothetical protein
VAALGITSREYTEFPALAAAGRRGCAGLLIALIVLAVMLVAGCTPPGLRALPGDPPGTVTGRDKRLVKNVAVYYVCIRPADGGRRACGTVRPATYAACTKGKKWPDCAAPRRGQRSRR